MAILFEAVHKKKFALVMDSLKVFIEGMGKIFINVVSLIVTADIFAKGLISFGFIDNLLSISQESVWHNLYRSVVYMMGEDNMKCLSYQHLSYQHNRRE